MVNPNQFKKALAQFASGVTVVTTMYQEHRIGVTASSFASLSLEPPLVLVCFGKQLFTHKAISEYGAFSVNLLSADQLDWGQRFAGMHPEIKDRFAGIDVHTAVTGSPLLPDCLAWLDCKIWQIYDGGDHSIFVGEVVAAYATDATLMPLLYHNRQWQSAAALSK